MNLDRDRSFAGTLTALIQKVSEGNMEAEDELFEKTIDELSLKAAAVARRFASFGEDPQSLVSDVWETLHQKLAAAEVNDRKHFFGLACKNFRWKILDYLKKNKNQVASPEAWAEALAKRSGGTGPVTNAIQREDEAIEREDSQRILEMLDSLDENLRQVVDWRVFLGHSFHEIEANFQVAHSTACDRFKQAVKQLSVNTHLVEERIRMLLEKLSKSG